MLHQEWISECVSRGLFLASHHNHFMNAAVTDEDIKKSIEIAEDAFSVVEKNHPELKSLKIKPRNNNVVCNLFGKNAGIVYFLTPLEVAVIIAL